MEPGRQRLSQRRKAAESSARVSSLAEVGPDRIEFADVFRPRPVDPAEGSPPAGSGAENLRTTSTLDLIPVRSRQVKWFAAVGALAVFITGGAASVPLLTPRGAPVHVVDTGATAPVAAIPSSELGDRASMPDSVPGGAPTRKSEGAVPAAPKPRTTQKVKTTVTPSRPSQDAATVAAQPDKRATAAEAYLRSRAAELGAHDPRWKHLTSPRP